MSLPVDVPAHTILDAWLKLLSEAIVHGIFDLHYAVYTPLPAPLMSVVSPLAGAGTTDNMVEVVVRAAVLSRVAPGSESKHVSPVSPFIDW